MTRSSSALRILLLAGVAGGCTVNSGVKTTPTFQAARYIPPLLPIPVEAESSIPHASLSGIMPSGSQGSRGSRGASVVALANRLATVEPTDATMHGASWVIDEHNETLIYRVPVQLKRVTTLLLPAGEKFNGAMGGNVEGFLINVAYAGPRPAVSILPREAGAAGNLQLATTAGLYSFDLVTTRATAINLVDIGHAANRPGGRQSAAEGAPQPEGDFTRLTFHAPKGPLPAWAPVEAWADSRKTVIRFQGPLPVLPALFAGQKGEQLVAYRTVVDQGSPVIVTNRRITEAELRLDAEVIALTVDGGGPDGKPVAAGGDATAPGWSQAANLPAPTAPAAPQPVNVYVLPGSSDGVVPASALTEEQFFGQSGPDAAPDPAQGQPLANHVVQPGKGI